MGRNVVYFLGGLHLHIVQRKIFLSDLRAEIKEVRKSVDSNYEILDTKIGNLRKEMHKQLYWIIGTTIAIASIIIAVFKL